MRARFNPSTRRVLFTASFGLAGIIVLAGCAGEDEPFRLETTGVTGTVVVDGVPVPASTPLMVECHNVNGFDQDHPTISSALTGENGAFEISTYESGDGVPAGDYALTFMWGDMDLISASYGGSDKLNGRYSDAEASEHKFTIPGSDDDSGAGVDLGTIELTTE